MPGFWSGRRVLVTGAGGFIGTHVVESLVRLEADVRGFFRYTSTSNADRADGVGAADVERIHGDLREPETVRRAVEGCDVVLHLGAEVAIPYSYRAPRQVVETNVLGTLNVLLAASDLDVERVVCASTSEVYGQATELPIVETHPLLPQSPYAASKAGADMLALAFHRSYGLQVGVVRPFNTYGPRQSARAVIPTIIIQALAGDSIRLGSTEPVRDFTYVSDTVDGILAFAAAEASPGAVVQLGTGEAVSVAELVTLVGGVVGRELVVEQDPQRVRPIESEVAALVSDPKLAREAFGWEPAVSLREGLERTVEWIEAHSEHYPEPRLYAV